MGWPLASIQGRSRPLDCCCSGVHSAARTGATRCLLDVLHPTDLLLLAALWLQDAVSADILQTARHTRELCVANAGAQVAGQQYEAMHNARTCCCQIQRAAWWEQARHVKRTCQAPTDEVQLLTQAQPSSLRSQTPVADHCAQAGADTNVCNGSMCTAGSHAPANALAALHWRTATGRRRLGVQSHATQAMAGCDAVYCMLCIVGKRLCWSPACESLRQHACTDL
jgi:hypothetical protein